MTGEYLSCDRRGSVAIATLNRPDKRNALCRALRDEIVQCLDELERDDEVNAVVLTGAGPVFCAGFDLAELAAGDAAAIFADARAYHHRVYTFSKPLVGAINGPALAGGMDLAIMCDLRVASQTATFGQPQVRMGIPAAYDLIRTVIPEAWARELCLSGRRVDADEALRLGLVNKVVAGDALMDEALAVAGEIAQSGAARTMKAEFLKAQARLFE
jgi:enoyl-CoA hydratase